MLRKIKGQETTSLSQLLSDKYKENVDNFQQGILVSKYKGIMYILGFPGGSEVKNPPAMRETWI